MTNFSWNPKSSILEWTHKGDPVKIDLNIPIENALPLKDGAGIAVVLDPQNQLNPNNALIINLDGSIRFRLRKPDSHDRDASFYYFNYVQGELTVILASLTRDFAYVVDPETGQFIRHYETR